jgi:hypothetical protein
LEHRKVSILFLCVYCSRSFTLRISDAAPVKKTGKTRVPQAVRLSVTHTFQLPQVKLLQAHFFGVPTKDSYSYNYNIPIFRTAPISPALSSHPMFLRRCLSVGALQARLRGKRCLVALVQADAPSIPLSPHRF